MPNSLYFNTVLEDEDSFLDYATTGVAASVISGATGLYNTMASLGNSLGASIDLADEGEVIGRTLGGEAEDFYGRHKTGIDAAGFLVSSFVPFGVAAKGVSVAARAGRLGEGMQAASGLKNGSVMLGSKNVQDAVRAYKALDTPTLMAPGVAKAFAAPVSLGVTEVVAGEALLALFNNQNAFINPESKEYWDAAGSQLWESATSPLSWTFLGADVGVRALRTKGFVKGEFRKSFVEANKVIDVAEGEIRAKQLAGMPAADAAAFFDTAIKSLKEADFNVADADEVLFKNRLAKRIQSLEDTKAAALGRLNSGNDAEVGTFIREQFLEQAVQDGELVNKLGGAESITRISKKEVAEQKRFMELTDSPTLLFGEGGTFGLDEMVEKVREAARTRGEEFTGEQLDGLTLYLRAQDFAGERSATRGSAVTSRGTKFSMTPDADGLAPAFKAFSSSTGKLLLVPADMVWTRKVTPEMMVNYNKGRVASGLKEITPKEQERFTLLHEISHIKSNSHDMINAVEGMQAAAKTDPDAQVFLKELVELSLKERGQLWNNVAKSTGLSVKELKESFISGEVLRNSNGDVLYHEKAEELLADAGALFSGARAEEAAKSAPTIAKLFLEHGGLKAPWQQAKGFVNTTSKQMRTNVLPGLADRGEVLVRSSGVISAGGKEYSASQGAKAFDFDTNGFTAGGLKYTEDEFEGIWIAASTLDLKPEIELLDHVEVAKTDLPKLERALVEEGLEQIMYDGQLISKARAEDILVREKTRLVQAFQLENAYNELSIAKFLNINDDAEKILTGLEKTDFLQMGQRDMTKPQWLQVNFNRKQIGGIDDQEASWAMTLQRAELLNDTGNQFAGKILGEDYGVLDLNISRQDLNDLSLVDQKASFFGAGRPDFGTFREKAAYIGKQVGDIIRRRTQEVEELFAPHFQNMNHPNNRLARVEMVAAENLLHKGSYTLRRTSDGTEVMVRTDFLEEVDSLEEFSLASLEGIDISDEVDVFKTLSPSVGSVMRMHYEETGKHFDSFKNAADGQGKHLNWTRDKLVPVHRDLKSERHYAFVQPTVVGEGKGVPKGMIFARTQQEFDAKFKVMTTGANAKDYKVVTASQVKDFKKLTGQYNAGDKFDEVNFDSELRSEFKTFDTAPNLDLTNSSTLERMRLMHQRRQEAIVREGVRLRHSETFDYLKQNELAYGKTNVDSVFGGRFAKEQDNIYADTANLMLGVRSNIGTGNEWYVGVSDYLGKSASAVLNTALRLTPTNRSLTIKDLEKVNAKLDDMGFQSPYEDVLTTTLASPAIQDTRSFNTLVRAMNGFVSTTMLTLDTAHHIVSTISTPILLLPVLREAKLGLKGTEQGVALEALTSVGVPGTKHIEPTPMKLMMDAVSSFWTPEGKAFMKELRERRLLPDYLTEYREAHDFADFDGKHSLGTVLSKVEQFRNVAGKYSGYRFSEDFSRYIVAASVKRVAELRGIQGEELYATISSSIDKVHAVHRSTQRAQFFNGPVGQAVGLFQSYSFNWMQNAMTRIEKGDTKGALMMAALQAGTFGARSLPGMKAMNSYIGESNRQNEDLYSLTNAYDEKSFGQYLMYGLGSHATLFPMDLYNRGDMNPRNPLFIPTSPGEIPGVSILAKFAGTLYDTAKNVGESITDDSRSTSAALIHGLAHNGLNRPLQGIGTIMQGAVTSGAGTTFIENANYINNDTGMNLSLGAGFARLLGSKPLTESVLMDEVFRKKAYQANARLESEALGTDIRLAIRSGQDLGKEQIDKYALDYERSGGNLENFNSFFTRQFQTANESQLKSWRDQYEQESVAKRAYSRLLQQRSTNAPWED